MSCVSVLLVQYLFLSRSSVGHQPGTAWLTAALCLSEAAMNRVSASALQAAAEGGARSMPPSLANQQAGVRGDARGGARALLYPSGSQQQPAAEGEARDALPSSSSAQQTAAEGGANAMPPSSANRQAGVRGGARALLYPPDSQQQPAAEGEAKATLPSTANQRQTAAEATLASISSRHAAVKGGAGAMPPSSAINQAAAGGDARANLHSNHAAVSGGAGPMPPSTASRQAVVGKETRASLHSLANLIYSFVHLAPPLPPAEWAMSLWRNSFWLVVWVNHSELHQLAVSLVRITNLAWVQRPGQHGHPLLAPLSSSADPTWAPVPPFTTCSQPPLAPVPTPTWAPVPPFTTCSQPGQHPHPLLAPLGSSADPTWAPVPPFTTCSQVSTLTPLLAPLGSSADPTWAPVPPFTTCSQPGQHLHPLLAPLGSSADPTWAPVPPFMTASQCRPDLGTSAPPARRILPTVAMDGAIQDCCRHQHPPAPYAPHHKRRSLVDLRSHTLPSSVAVLWTFAATRYHPGAALLELVLHDALFKPADLAPHGRLHQLLDALATLQYVVEDRSTSGSGERDGNRGRNEDKDRGGDMGGSRNRDEGRVEDGNRVRYGTGNRDEDRGRGRDGNRDGGRVEDGDRGRYGTGNRDEDRGRGRDGNRDWGRVEDGDRGRYGTGNRDEDRGRGRDGNMNGDRGRYGTGNRDEDRGRGRDGNMNGDRGRYGTGNRDEDRGRGRDGNMDGDATSTQVDGLPGGMPGGSVDKISGLGKLRRLPRDVDHFSMLCTALEVAVPLQSADAIVRVVLSLPAVIEPGCLPPQLASLIATQLQKQGVAQKEGTVGVAPYLLRAIRLLGCPMPQSWYHTMLFHVVKEASHHYCVPASQLVLDENRHQSSVPSSHGVDGGVQQRQTQQKLQRKKQSQQVHQRRLQHSAWQLREGNGAIALCLSKLLKECSLSGIIPSASWWGSFYNLSECLLTSEDPSSILVEAVKAFPDKGKEIPLDWLQKAEFFSARMAGND
eukprot:gene5230-18461_t